MNKPRKKGAAAIIVAIIIAAIALAAVLFSRTVKATSSNDYCMSCHVHTDADSTYRLSMHTDLDTSKVANCVECHLPPDSTFDYYVVKAKSGIKDVWSYITKNRNEINWESKGELGYAEKIVFNESCKKCHKDLFPKGINDDGVIAHLYYEDNEKALNLQCISCHLNAGHYNPNYTHGKMTSAPLEAPTIIYDKAAELTGFENFIETVPGTGCSISMIAVPGGTFTMGSSSKEPFHKADEGPERKVTVSQFYMSEIEVTWNQYWTFYSETMSEGRTPPEVVYANNALNDIDAISGPTPPFGAPDQSWGMGERPAITMTHYAAETFCQWLSLKTGKTYRLPTEAEWEYAARGGTSTPYFFEGNPKKLVKKDTTHINSFVVYERNSKNKTQTPDAVGANPFGLKNMLGNVMEYCSDWYAEDAYSRLPDDAVDPQGPASGTEHVVRGGAYNSSAADLRCAARAHTEHDDWLRTDPQNPKSIWWYSDIKGIGFRIVCEASE